MNSKVVIAVVVVAVVVLGGYFLLKGTAYKAPVSAPAPAPALETPSEETTPTTQEQEPSGQKVVAYTDSGYSPSTLQVKAGETVVFVNGSSKAMWPASAFHPTHTVYSGTSLSEHCGSPDNTAFDACMGIQPGDVWSFTFDKVGTWKYHDHLSPENTGTIVVE